MDPDAYREFKTLLHESSIRNIQNANASEQNLCGQLILLCTVFLTINVVVVGNSETLELLSTPGKILLVLGLIVIFCSIAAGIKYYLNVKKFHESWGKSDHTKYEILRDHRPEDWPEALKKLKQNNIDLSEIMSASWLHLQIFLLGVGAFVYMLLVISLLFDFGLK